MKSIQDSPNKEIFEFTGTFSKLFNFEASKTYDPLNNYLLAQLCGLVYKDKQEIHNQVTRWKENNNQLKVIIRDIDSFRYMILSNQDYIIVVFRGSENLKNWLADFDITMVPFKNNSNNLVHQGFRDSVFSMQYCINKDIIQLQNQNQNIYITGHSLGGAQAILSGFMCKSLLQFTNITTFGEPKIGDFNLCNLFNLTLNSSPASNKSRIYRVVNSFDPVPYLPTNYLFKFYYHEGLFYLYAGIGDNLYQIESNESLLKSENIIDMPKNQEDLLEWNVNRHSITEYILNAEDNQDFSVFEKE